jgi:hypothetical protein
MYSRRRPVPAGVTASVGAVYDRAFFRESTNGVGHPTLRAVIDRAYSGLDLTITLVFLALSINLLDSSRLVWLLPPLFLIWANDSHELIYMRHAPPGVQLPDQLDGLVAMEEECTAWINSEAPACTQVIDVFTRIGDTGRAYKWSEIRRKLSMESRVVLQRTAGNVTNASTLEL